MSLYYLSLMRRASIDIFRALTMFLMIFVNDLWSLTGYPHWLGHATVHEDFLGFSDIIFPAFLFIVGLSIPLAIDRRFDKGDNVALVLWHIFQRTLALVVMGFYMVNFENINDSAMPFSKYLWEIGMAVAIFLIWTDYKEGKVIGNINPRILQFLGILFLLGLSLTYRNQEGSAGMSAHWWGILGLIGWSYLYVALAYLAIGKRILLFSLLLILFFLLNAQEFFYKDIGMPKIVLLESASHYSLVACGALATILMVRLKENAFITMMFVLAAVMILYGFLVRPNWGINKILATPSWTAITAGISFASFGVLYLVADVWKKQYWAEMLSPAGRSTLTCYLVPYVYYPIVAMIGVQLPEFLRSGPIGLLKSLLFAVIVVAITRLLEIVNLRLKI